jgi:type IV pilus assembly protein PilM
MADKIVALDVGSSQLKAVEAVIKNNVPTITKVASIPLATEIVRNGEILDIGQLSGALKQLWRAGRFSTKNVYTFATGSDMINRVIPDVLAAQDEKQFKEMLPYVIRDKVPFPVDDYYLDSHSLDEEVRQQAFKAPARYRTVLVTGVLKSYIDNIAKAIQMAGLHPVKIDTLAFALIREARVEASDEARMVASVEVGAEETTIVVHEDSQPVYLHSSKLGGRRVTEQIAAQTGLPFIEAEFLKIALSSSEDERNRMMRLIPVENSLPKELTYASFDARAISSARTAIAQEVSNFISHVNDILDESASQLDRDVEVIILSGGGAKLLTLINRLESESTIPTRFAKPLEHIKNSKLPPQVLDNQHIFAALAGLTLESNV